MRLKSIQSKVFLLFIMLTMVLLLMMSAMVRYGFNKQFNTYRLNQAELLNQQVIYTLETYFEQNGHWADLQNNGRLWAHLLVGSATDVDVEPLIRGKIKRRQSNQHEDNNLRRLLPQFRLLDANKSPVVGRKNRPVSAYQQSPIVNQGQTVGYLLAIQPKATDITEDPKMNKGIQIFLGTLALVMLLITLVATWPIARYFSQPIKAINAATKKAAAGDFTVRTQVERKDELGQLSQNFNLLTSTLQSNAQVQKNMMADISHELRTPVAVLQAQIEAIQDGIHQADEKNLNLLHQQISSLGHLINDLHQLNVADLGSLQYQMQAVAIKPIIEAVIEAVQLSADEKDLALNFTSATVQSEAKVLGDKVRLQQMLNNLLVNAVAYTDTKGEINVQLLDDTGNNELVILINDSAPSLQPDEITKMFEPLYRKESSRNKQTGGSGLGLAIVKKIVAAHNGSISASTAELGGICMSVRLPKHV